MVHPLGRPIPKLKMPFPPEFFLLEDIVMGHSKISVVILRYAINHNFFNFIPAVEPIFFLHWHVVGLADPLVF